MRTWPPREGPALAVGVPKELKVHEYRCGLTPGAVREYVAHGHSVVDFDFLWHTDAHRWTLPGSPIPHSIGKDDSGVNPCEFGALIGQMALEICTIFKFCAGIRTNEPRSHRYHHSVGTHGQRPRQPGRACRARRALEHGDRTAAEGARGRRVYPRLSGRAGSVALWSHHHRSG